MREFVSSVHKKPLIHSLQKRFYIKKDTAKSYLCLLFLLIDNGERETTKSKGLEWGSISVLILLLSFFRKLFGLF